MNAKKVKAQISLFPTESEFHTLLTIHNEIKKKIIKLFPHINNQVIDTLFSILSSQALLYDQIIRKATLLQGSVTKQSQITKLVQGNRISFENKIHDHLNTLSLSFKQLFIEAKEEKEGMKEEKETEAYLNTNTKSNIGNVSINDSLQIEQESIIARIKKKMKMERPQHIRTNSCFLTTNMFEQEERKINTKVEKVKQILYQTENLIPKYQKIKLQLNKKNKTICPTQHTFYQNKQNAHSALLSLTQLRCLTERNSTEKEVEVEVVVGKKQNVNVSKELLSYQSFPKTEEIECNRVSSNPSKYAKQLLKKYQDIVDSYEKIETDEDDIIRQNEFRSKLVSKNDIRTATEDNKKSTKSFTIIDYRNILHQKIPLSSNNVSKPKRKTVK